jgi:sec-independent protein translocase protein TatB
VFDINGGEFIILMVLAVVILGPERLPQYAAQLGRFVREAKGFAVKAREQVREELGEEFDDVDWQALDPRRYDPRRIVRDALLDGDDDPFGLSDSAPHVPPAMRPEAAGADDGALDDVTSSDRPGPTAPLPYDADAT